MEHTHIPVLVHEVVECLIAQPDGVYVDGTVGNGGHSLEAARSLSDKGRLICLDRDPDAVIISRQRLAPLGEKVQVVRAGYGDLDTVLENLGMESVNGILLDLGMSSSQLEKSGRGFSFQRDEPLDMRMDPDEQLTAYSLINSLPGKELAGLLRAYGEERRAGYIARAIVNERGKKPIETTSHLASLIESISPPSRLPGGIHPATRTFQALRIAVNKELQNLETFLEKIPSLLEKGGRLVILSYHSLEDRLVKQAMVRWEKGCTCPPDFPLCICGNVPLCRRLFKKGIKPSREEISHNPRARSAILRAAERI